MSLGLLTQRLTFYFDSRDWLDLSIHFDGLLSCQELFYFFSILAIIAVLAASAGFYCTLEFCFSIKITYYMNVCLDLDSKSSLNLMILNTCSVFKTALPTKEGQYFVVIYSCKNIVNNIQLKLAPPLVIARLRVPTGCICNLPLKMEKKLRCSSLGAVYVIPQLNSNT